MTSGNPGFTGFILMHLNKYIKNTHALCSNYYINMTLPDLKTIIIITKIIYYVKTFKINTK